MAPFDRDQVRSSQQPKGVHINECPYLSFVIMKLLSIATALSGFIATALANSAPRTSTITLPAEFKPPQVFKNANLVHIISLEKNYAKEQINVLIENVADEPQSEYYLPFTAGQISRVGGFEVKDRKEAEAGPFLAEIVEYDPLR